MYSRQNNKRAVETYIVGNSSEALFNVANATEDIVNRTQSVHAGLGTDAITLNDGQIGVFDASGYGSNSINTAITSGNTVVHSPVIYIAQGTQYSANPSNVGEKYPLWNRALERSADINGHNWIVATKKDYVAARHSTWVVGKPAGNAQQIVAYDNTEYQVRIGFRGRRMDEFYNSEGTATVAYSYVTPNYTTLGTAEPRDHLIQNLCWDILRNTSAFATGRERFRGNAPVVALAIDSTSTTGTDADTLTAGNFLGLVNTTTGVKGITLTAENIASIQAALSTAGFAADASILTIDTSTAGTTTGGVADAFILMALEADLAYEDRIPQVQTRLEVGLTTGFDYNTVYHAEGQVSKEGQGQGRVLDLMYKATHGQRKYSLDHTLDPVIEFPSPFSASTNYIQYVFEHVDINQIDTSNLSESPKKTIVCLPTGATAIAAFDTLINAWLATANGAKALVTV